MYSRLVVISWWSNCLGLACLHRLAQYTEARPLSVVQVGKSAAQRRKFVEQLPRGVTELPYSESAPAEHSRVLRDVALRQLRAEAGVWFVDHDVLLNADGEHWLQATDRWLVETEFCLCLPALPSATPAITQPAFWLSPTRWPAALNNFDPIPFAERIEAKRPDLHRANGDLRMPEKDTLMVARDALAARRQLAYFPLSSESSANTPLPPFPAHQHLGGLSLFAGPVLSAPIFQEWMRATVQRFTDFYATCPADWLASEDQVLLARLREFQEAVHA